MTQLKFKLSLGLILLSTALAYGQYDFKPDSIYNLIAQDSIWNRGDAIILRDGRLVTGSLLMPARVEEMAENYFENSQSERLDALDSLVLAEKQRILRQIREKAAAIDKELSCVACAYQLRYFFLAFKHNRAPHLRVYKRQGDLQYLSSQNKIARMSATLQGDRSRIPFYVEDFYLLQKLQTERSQGLSTGLTLMGTGASILSLQSLLVTERFIIEQPQLNRGIGIGAMSLVALGAWVAVHAEQRYRKASLGIGAHGLMLQLAW